MKRRRFLSIAAAFAATPLGAAAAPLRWSGIAFGAEASLALSGPEALTRPALEAALATLRRIEAQFSLFDPASLLQRLNRSGRLDMPPPEMRDLMAAAGRIHTLTDGLFDPSVQPLWQAAARGDDVAPARAAIGWDRVQVSDQAIVLGPGQALTFNGIAQGFATDLIRAQLRAAGLRDLHVNIGEHMADGPALRLGLEDPGFGHLGHVTLKDAAVATSSPGAMPLARGHHILHPGGAAPRWSTVSVVAKTATLADGLSTALCLADEALVERCAALREVETIRLVDHRGDLVSY